MPATSAIRQRIATALTSIPDLEESNYAPELFPALENGETLDRTFAVHLGGWTLYTAQRQRGDRREPLFVQSPVQVKWSVALTVDGQLQDIDEATDLEEDILAKMYTLFETEDLSMTIESSARSTNTDGTYISGVLTFRAIYPLLEAL